MSERTPYPPRGSCPCGSGEDHADCCAARGLEYWVDESGDVFRSVPLDDETLALLEEQKRRFADVHGREPAGDDLLFFDAPPLEHLEADLSALLGKSGVDPALIHAFERTGRLVTAENRHLIPPPALEEWDAAVAEYRPLHITEEEE